jgi:hypothetical protein
VTGIEIRPERLAGLLDAMVRPVAENLVGFVRCGQCGVLWRSLPGPCSCGGTRSPEPPGVGK